MTLQTAPANVADIVAAAIQVVEPVARRVPVHLHADIGDALPALVVDSDRVVQALVNLLSNAVKFAPAGSEVRIEARQEGSEISIAIQDEGMGISSEDLARLFQKFQQVDGSASRRKGGTGLGLVISKALVEQHGGRIDVRSEVGKGTRFTILLPASTMAAPVAVAPIERAAARRGGTVLIIDDDDEFRLVIRRHLERAGYRVFEAREGAAGLHVARETRPDVITLDLMMPGMNGWELLARLSADPDLSSIPVVIISAVADQAGPLTSEVSVMAKPITQERLLSEISEAVATPGATVLIAEDDADLRRVFSEVLARRGHRVIVAHDGAEALAELERSHIDLLVLDLKMPNVDGLTVIQRVRESARGRDIPILVVSGGEGAGEFRAMKLGADAYLPKPIDAGELAERIEALVARAAPI